MKSGSMGMARNQRHHRRRVSGGAASAKMKKRRRARIGVISGIGINGGGMRWLSKTASISAAENALKTENNENSLKARLKAS
jgi:hypothetical protein